MPIVFRVLACLFVLTLGCICFGETMAFKWVERGNGPSWHTSEVIAVDPGGNIYVAGQFTGTLRIGTNSLSSSNINFKSLFLAKYDAHGNNVGAVRFTGRTPYVGFYPQAMVLDKGTNLYVAGFFEGTVEIGTNILSSAGLYDVLILKFDSFGNPLWARKAGGTGYDYGFSISTGESNSVYVTGVFERTATFGTNTLTTFGSRDVFLAKFDDDGSLSWVRQAGGIGEDYAYTVASDLNGSVYVGGSFEYTASFGGTNLNSGGNRDAFLAKYGATGNLAWASKATAEGGTSSDARFSGMAVDASGAICVFGSFLNNYLHFDGTTLTNSGGRNVFVAKFDQNGKPSWVRSATGDFYYNCKAIAVNGAGDVYVSGAFHSATVAFGSENITNRVNAGLTDIFIAKYDTLGDLNWVEHAGGANDDLVSGIVVDRKLNTYITGFFECDAHFGPITVTHPCERQFFLARLVPRPRLTLEQNQPSRQRLNIFGAIDTYQVSMSQDLVNWTVLASVNVESNGVGSLELEPPSSGQTFYRVQLP